jgi:hypothetical protein
MRGPLLIHRENGQMAMIAIMIIVVLVLGVAIVSFLNQVQGRFGVAVQQRQQSSQQTQAGLSYAIFTLEATPLIWASALNGVFPQGFDGSTYFNPGQGNYSYTISCSTGPAAYQVSMLVTAYNNAGGQPAPLRAILAQVSQKTMAVSLPNNITASSALEVFQAPTISTIAVHWGPVTVYDPNAVWYVNNPMDTSQYPRKFSEGNIT